MKHTKQMTTKEIKTLCKTMNSLTFMEEIIYSSKHCVLSWEETAKMIFDLSKDRLHKTGDRDSCHYIQQKRNVCSYSTANLHTIISLLSRGRDKSMYPSKDTRTSEFVFDNKEGGYLINNQDECYILVGKCITYLGNIFQTQN